MKIFNKFMIGLTAVIGWLLVIGGATAIYWTPHLHGLVLIALGVALVWKMEKRDPALARYIMFMTNMYMLAALMVYIGFEVDGAGVFHVLAPLWTTFVTAKFWRK